LSNNLVKNNDEKIEKYLLATEEIRENGSKTYFKQGQHLREEQSKETIL
jgi:hypothetical protein